MRLNLELLENREVPYSVVVTSVDGIIQLRDETGYIVNNFRPFEDEASKVPLSVGIAKNTIHIGAGIGGGPRYQIRDLASLKIIRDTFIGDKESRTGVNISIFNDDSEKSNVIDSIVSVNNSSPSSVSNIELEHVKTFLFKIPTNSLKIGGTVSVYSGGPLTSLPQFSYLKNVLTPTINDGIRTYDEIYNAADGTNSYINPNNLATGSVNTVMHEWSHTYDAKFSFSTQLKTMDVFSRRGAWASDINSYYSNVQEWFAEGLTRYLSVDNNSLTLEENYFFSGVLNG